MWKYLYPGDFNLKRLIPEVILSSIKNKNLLSGLMVNQLEIMCLLMMWSKLIFL